MEPPPSWWVLTYSKHTRSWNELYVYAITNFPDHLSMAWSYTMPTRQGIWKVVRGKTVFCGYKYIWDTPTIVEQNWPGDTDDHVWLLQNLESDRHIWYYLFAPLGPYGLEIQGPLMHVPPPEAHLWTQKMYAGTMAKGIFYTESFSGPGGPPPIWRPSNSGLLSLKIRQLESDPLGVQYRHYCIAGDINDRTLYKRVPPISPAWLPLLTTPQAVTLTGSTGGELRWVATNPSFPGHLYVLFNSSLTDNGTWCIRSTDYGETWAASPIYAGIFNREAGNISVGLTQGSSPYDPGTVLYAALCTGAGGASGIWLSTNAGLTWAFRDQAGLSTLIPRCLVDPTDQSIVYIGAFLAAPHPHELHRSTEHGLNLLEIDGALHLGIMIHPWRPQMWINPTDHDTATVLATNHIFTTTDNCLTWDDWGLTDDPVARLAILWENPSRLYLANYTSGSFPPLGSNNHVIFVSDTHGIYMEGKAGEHPYFEDGGGDSIPYDCGGVCLNGMMLFPPY